MIKTIIKRDGSIEQFMPSKLNRWAEWATQTLGTRVDWTSVVLTAVSSLPEQCSSEQLQEMLIKTCLDLDTWSYNRMAGRLYAALIHKQFYNNQFPTVRELQAKLVDLGLMEALSYTDAEWTQIESIINHKQDFKYAHYQINQSLSKYSIQNRVTKERYETPQFMYMRMAMALAEGLPKERRMNDLEKWYIHLSNNRLNAPTPNHVNLGTKLHGFASCNVYTVGDNAKSLAIGDHIAYTMTYQSAGIGAHLDIRSIGDPVRSGQIKHQGKLNYYRALNAAVKANTQNGRGGACTVYFPIYDPEVETLVQLKNPMSTEDRRIRGMDYSWGYNKFIARKAAKNEDVFLFNSYNAPDLYEALYCDDESKFETLYAKYESDPLFEKQYVNARNLIIDAINQWYETGRIYSHNVYEMNHHTPFKDTIYSSNLCFTGDTLVAVADGRPAARIDDLAVESNGTKKFPVYSARKRVVDNKKEKNWKAEIAAAVAFKSGTKQVIKVVLSNGDTFECTADHKLALSNGEYIEAKDSLGKQLEGFFVGVEEVDIFVTEIIDEGKVTDVYDLTVEDNHNFYIITSKKYDSYFQCSGVLVHNCSEIALPTSPYYDMRSLYSEEDHGQGEIGLCSLAAINVPLVESEELYEEVAYYALLMIDRCIDMNHYELPHLGVTAQARRSAGVGMIGLAYAMAKAKKAYSSQDGKDYIHELAERHAYHLIKASLKLGKEFGNAKWMHKTKWPEGWLPLDTYNKNVDDVITVENKYDWEALRSEIIENKGIRHSVIIAHMPSESSSISAGSTNSVLPIRELTLIKTDNERSNYWAAPEGDKIGKWYEISWDISSKDMTDVYAIIQKWTDQGISADFYRRLTTNSTVTSTEMLTDFLYRVKMGLKTTYYMNTKTSDGVKDSNYDDVILEYSEEEEGGVCEGCTL